MCAAIIQQIELHIPAAANELVFPLGFRPRLMHAPLNDLGIDVEKCEANVASEAEIGLPVSGIVMIVEDSARPARFAAVR